jgi:hypothetical protein
MVKQRHLDKTFSDAVFAYLLSFKFYAKLGNAFGFYFHFSCHQTLFELKISVVIR